MSTIHISANKKDIAKIVLMSGDPLRAKLFAETYLKNYKQINNIRGMLGYTGTYKGKEITVMGHGMGLESIGIYAYELYTEYEVNIIIRFGSCGAYNKNINLLDIIIVKYGYTKSNYGTGFGFSNIDTIEGTPRLIKLAQKVANEYETKQKIITTTANASMWFYKTHDIDSPEEFVSKGIDVVEMESYALYAIAKSLKKEALCLLTVSDQIVKKEMLNANERRTAFKDVFEIMLNIINKL